MFVGNLRVVVFSYMVGSVVSSVFWSLFKQRADWIDVAERDAAIKDHLRNARPLSTEVRRRLWRLLAGLNTPMGDKVYSVQQIEMLAKKASAKSIFIIDEDFSRSTLHSNIPNKAGIEDDVISDVAYIGRAGSRETEAAVDKVVPILPKDLHTTEVQEPRVTIDRAEALRTILKACDGENGGDVYIQSQNVIAATILEIETDIRWAYALYKYIMKDMQNVQNSVTGEHFKEQSYFLLLKKIVLEQSGPLWCVEDDLFNGMIVTPAWMSLFGALANNADSRYVVIDQFLAFGFQFIVQMTAHFYVKYKPAELVNQDDSSGSGKKMRLRLEAMLGVLETTNNHIRKTHKKWKNPPYVMIVWSTLSYLHLQP